MSKSQFVVIIERGEHRREVFGPYRNFKHAEGDAKAWDGFVEPVRSPDEGADEIVRRAAIKRATEG